MTQPVIIYYNPACGTSRAVLALIREAGAEPHIIEYLKTPPDMATLVQLAEHAGGVRGLLRDKEPLCQELGLSSKQSTDAELLAQMLAHPILINRPIVVTPLGTKLCRPPETVRTLLAKTE
jgi:arsenate reductase